MTGIATDHHDGGLGRVRSRSLGAARAGVPELVLIHGMTACDYMVPGLRELATWTRAHLIDLPGCGGSGEPPHELTVAEFADAVLDWLDHRGLSRVVLVGHSSGTQVAAEAARRRPGDVTAVVLASPVFDPAYRRLAPVLWRWALDLTREPSSLERANRPERKRAGLRRLLHVLHEHRHYNLPDAVADLRVPVLVLRGRDDALTTPGWPRRLAALAAEGSFAEVNGPHTFNWQYPAAWSAPIRAFAVT
ncbi:alpha/beta fold hydrolase [Paractinoplanes globisporus]|uniref:Alpha/beta fold hydrolase n=1 Tax=Paractinoplanes globisporus TaxID=113565 RepID=A0ABW6WFF8_9ACTN|nr:alpha/beta hydrolase [Actinoplanes globisporus]